MENPSKSESQTVLYAIEELYFYRRFEEGTKLAEKALASELSEDLRKTLQGYRERCIAKHVSEQAKNR